MLILATETYQVLSGTDETLQEICLDLDMAILGKDSKVSVLTTWPMYAGALLRKEYRFVPHDKSIVRNGPAEILQGFLQKSNIYLSPQCGSATLPSSSLGRGTISEGKPARGNQSATKGGHSGRDGRQVMDGSVNYFVFLWKKNSSVGFWLLLSCQHGAPVWRAESSAIKN
jgi:hypothetical protein